MLSTVRFLALASIAFAAPQDIAFDAIDNATQPSITGPPVGTDTQIIPLDVQAAVASVSAAVEATPLAVAVARKRTLGFNDPCGPQPDGYAPKPLVDTVSAFLAYPFYQTQATSAVTPQGYQRSFTNLQGSVNGKVYLGLYTLASYDTAQCSANCDATAGCAGFNLFFERDPTINPAPACPCPSSFTNAKCTLWGAGVTAAMAVNTGQYREQFVVVITGSNGYNKVAAPPAQANFNGPVQLAGAINAPLLNGVDTYLGYKFFPTAFLPALCAAACQAQTAYDRATATNSVYKPANFYKPCNFFTAYIMSKNDRAQGLYCALYTHAWDPSYATNTGQFRGTDVYTISSAYSYTLTQQDSGVISRRGLVGE